QISGRTLGYHLASGLVSEVIIKLQFWGYRCLLYSTEYSQSCHFRTRQTQKKAPVETGAVNQN
ncbi:MAG TPA: hypothetical protein VNS58_30635, partial [Puia sp.]|nr:hypothetical protein [Puia sp.]